MAWISKIKKYKRLDKKKGKYITLSCCQARIYFLLPFVFVLSSFLFSWVGQRIHFLIPYDTLYIV